MASVYCNKIPIYRIFYLLKGDYSWAFGHLALGDGIYRDYIGVI